MTVVGSGELYSVRNGSHVSDVCEGVAVFRDDVGHCDVVLEGEDKGRLKCHRVVLAAASPLLAHLLTLHPIVGDEDVHMCVPQASTHVLGKLLDFCYTGKTVVDKGDLQALMDVASCLKIKFLKDVVVRVVRAAVKRPVNIRPKINNPTATATTTTTTNTSTSTKTTSTTALTQKTMNTAAVTTSVTSVTAPLLTAPQAAPNFRSNTNATPAPRSVVSSATTTTNTTATAPTLTTSSSVGATESTLPTTTSTTAKAATVTTSSVSATPTTSTSATATKPPTSINIAIPQVASPTLASGSNTSTVVATATNPASAPTTLSAPTGAEDSSKLNTESKKSSEASLKRKSKNSESDTDSADSDDEKGRNYEANQAGMSNDKGDSKRSKKKETSISSSTGGRSTLKRGRKTLPVVFTIRQQNDVDPDSKAKNKEESKEAAYLVHMNKNSMAKITSSATTPSKTVKGNVLRSSQPIVGAPPMLVAKAIGNDSSGQQKILLLKPTSKQPLKRIVVPSSSTNSGGTGGGIVKDRGVSKLVLSPPTTNLAPTSPSFQIETMKQADGTQITFLRQVQGNKGVTNPSGMTSSPKTPDVANPSPGDSQTRTDANKQSSASTKKDDSVSSKGSSAGAETNSSALKVNGKRMSVSQPRHVIPATLPEDFLADDEPEHDKQPEVEKERQTESDAKSRGNNENVVGGEKSSKGSDKESIGRRNENSQVESTTSSAATTPTVTPSRVSGRLRKANKKYSDIEDKKSNEKKRKTVTTTSKPAHESVVKTGNSSTNVSTEDKKKSKKKDEVDEKATPTAPRGTRSRPKPEPKKNSEAVLNKKQKESAVASAPNVRVSKRRSSLAATEKIDTSKRQRRAGLRRN